MSKYEVLDKSIMDKVRDIRDMWERTLVEAEWGPLLTDPTFMADLTEGIEDMLSTMSLADEFLLIKNWPKDAHESLMLMLPGHLANAFDLSSFRPDGVLPKLNETEGFRLLSGYGVCTYGWDARRLLSDGSPCPIGPYADIAAIQRVPLPIRLDQTSGARVRVMPDGNGLVLMVNQFRCGQARSVGNGMFCVEEEFDDGKTTVVLSNAASQSASADLLLAAGQRQAIELAPFAA